jgi:hypothetical protein
MKKLLFYISIIISLILLINILKILTYDLERLTDYGFGYLVGKTVLFLVFLTLTILTKKYLIKKSDGA